MNAKIIAAIVIILAIAGSYFICVHSESAVVAEMVEASRKGDADAFANRIDWESLRDSLKDDITAQKKIMGTYGTGVGPEASQIGPIVDYYVRPENIAVLFYYHQTLLPAVKEEEFIDGMGFAPPFGFYVTLAYPASNPMGLELGAMMHEKLRTHIVFRLSGLTWKVKAMHVPLFMAPTQTRQLPDAAQMKKPAGK